MQGERQPGSSFKPFVLAAALEQGISPSTTFESNPVTIALGDRIWHVHNYEGRYLGAIDLRTATAYSDNSVYAQLTQHRRPAQRRATAHKLGITSPLNPYFAIGLGAEPVNPLEMARAFAAFANGGQRIDGALFGNRPRVDRLGRTATRSTSDERRGRCSSADRTRRSSTDILQEVVQYGTGKRARARRTAPVAGKTGTTENYGDAWFVGYTPQLVAAVWVGYPNKLRPMLTEYHGDPVAGGTYPALIWKSFMERRPPYRTRAPQSFPAPNTPGREPGGSSCATARSSSTTGSAATRSRVQYFSGRGPRKTANCKPNEVEVPNVVGDVVRRRARRSSTAQPLTPVVVYKPAPPGQRARTWSSSRSRPAGGCPRTTA